MKRCAALIIAIVILLALSSSLALAQHQHSATPPQNTSSEVQPDPMQECQKHHAEATAALDQAVAKLGEAKRLSDGQMRAAIESAEQQIGEAKHHLSMCPMAKGGSMDHSGTGVSQQQGHKMKCMSKDSQPE